MTLPAGASETLVPSGATAADIELEFELPAAPLPIGVTVTALSSV